jgi:hypothetical protein
MARAARPQTEIDGPVRAHYITSRAAAAVVGHAVLDSYTQAATA